MIIVHSIKSGKFYIIEFNESGFIHSPVNEEFALTSKLKLVKYNDGPMIWDFRRFVLSHKP